ncbi:MAG TPA: hypothetical protein VFT22_25585 [Kofleriaceae bacterium]|nr:hypothetical protein [Kofleriaceae bacterium]
MITTRLPRRSATLALALALAPASAAAEPVAVKVVDVAGGAAYLAPGRAAGIAPGTKIRLRGVEVTVVEVTEKTAMVRIDGARIAIGDAGTADVTPGAPGTIRRLDRPRPPEAFAGQWRDPVLPASQQRPEAVPLGSARGPGSGAHVTVVGHAFGVVARPASGADAEARVIAGFDLARERPLAAELDVAQRWFSDGFDRRTHTPVLVRAAELRYGDAVDPRLAVGRIRSAAASVGMLDGGRASARIGTLEIAAFGGLVPDPLSGKPDTSAARFGAELTYDAPDRAWQPRIGIAAHGSTWDGELDERRLSVDASAARGALALSGWSELEAFAADNPWGARSVELTGAGVTAQWRRRGAYAGVDLTYLLPERSLRLAAALPPEWLCTLAPGMAAERCASGDWWGSATASAGTRTARWSLDGVVTLGDSHGQYRGLDRSGFVHGELRAGPARLLAGLAGGQSSFSSWTAGEVGAAYVPDHALDVAVTYRPELLDYVASTGPQLLHSMIADARLALSTVFDLAVSVVGTTGGDRDALAALATFVWRPLP